MKIIPYRDLESKDGLLPLPDHAFYWVFNQHQFDDLVKIDPGLKNSPVGFCAVEDGQIIGHVGVMDLATRTLDRSIEYVGGLYNVATLPGYMRRGVCTALMNRAHEYFMDKHYRFSFLSTSQALVAHALYEKLGYVDLTQYPSVYKVFHDKKAKHSQKRIPKALTEKEFLEFTTIFRKRKQVLSFGIGRTSRCLACVPVPKLVKMSVDGFCGKKNSFFDHSGLNTPCTVSNFLLSLCSVSISCVSRRAASEFRNTHAHAKIEGIKSKTCIIGEEGYAMFREGKMGIWIRELVALNVEQMHELTDILEKRTRGAVYDREVLDARLLEVYRSRSYMVQNRSFGLTMFKPLTSVA